MYYNFPFFSLYIIPFQDKKLQIISAMHLSIFNVPVDFFAEFLLSLWKRPGALLLIRFLTFS